MFCNEVIVVRIYGRVEKYIVLGNTIIGVRVRVLGCFIIGRIG